MREYLDHNATSPLSDEARERLREHLDTPLANPGSVHAEGQRARGLLERARRTTLQRLGKPGGRVVFTGGATESNNMVLQSAVSRGDHVLSSRLEHPSVVEPLRHAKVTWLAHDSSARWDLDALDAALDDCGLVSLIWGNNELGTLNPIDVVAERCLKKGVPLHIDAAQVFGRLPVVVPKGVSTMTLCAHKAGGPIGVGALWIAEDAVAPKLVVGGHQERGTRAGTEDVARIDAWLATPLDNRWSA
ncbi:MAG: cysteine desulfurase, partial [Bradymonadia bacterium]